MLDQLPGDGRHAAGLLERPTTGQVIIDGQDAGALDEGARTRLRLNRIGFVYQFHHLLPDFTALENVAMPAIIGGASQRSVMPRAREMLDRVGLSARMDSKIATLSGGERQRVAIARALVNNPAVILADEATGNLDSRTSFEILVLFQKLHAEGRTIIFVTHNPEIAQYSSRNITLRDGHVTADTVNTNILSAAEALARLPKNDD